MDEDATDEPGGTLPPPPSPKRRRRLLVGGALVVLVLAAVGVAAAVKSRSSASLAAFSDDPLVTCGGQGPSFSASKLWGPDDAQHANDPAARAFLADLEDPNGPPAAVGGPPINGWRIVAKSDTEALFVGGAAGHRWSNRYVQQKHTWHWANSSGCDVLTVEQPGLGVASVVLDADESIKRKTTTIHLFVQGVACNDGRSTTPSEVIGPKVHVDAHRIVVTAAVRPRGHTFQTCQGPIRIAGDGPPRQVGAEVTVELKAPVGNRPVLDGNRYPYEPLSYATD